MSKLSIFILLCVCLHACSPPNKVAVVERATVDRNIEIDRIGGSLVRHVQPGDTLYSIAFAMGLDANDVAAWNNVNDVSKLHVGQRIRLTKPMGFVAVEEVVVTKRQDKQVNAQQQDSTNSSIALDSSPAIGNSPVLNTSPEPDQKTGIVTSVPSTQQVIPTVSMTAWGWPLVGKVIHGFARAQGQQGIDIQASKGQAVFSANTGEVVYVGNSLKGYGNLIIIKHSDTYISAYAHNHEIFVREGERVGLKQRIASAGVNRYGEPALHFQIRKNGQPVNPISYLPKTG